MLDYLREHQEVIPYLYSKILQPNPNWAYLPKLLRLMYNSMSKECFAPLLMAIFPHDVWMALWEAYGDPKIPPFLGDIISLETLVMVPPTPNEIPPPDAPIDSTGLVPTIDAPNLVQQDTSCLPTSASWDDFFPDITRLFMESHIEDVGDIIDDINLLFVEETVDT